MKLPDDICMNDGVPEVVLQDVTAPGQSPGSYLWRGWFVFHTAGFGWVAQKKGIGEVRGPKLKDVRRRAGGAGHEGSGLAWGQPA